MIELSSPQVTARRPSGSIEAAKTVRTVPGEFSHHRTRRHIPEGNQPVILAGQHQLAVCGNGGRRHRSGDGLELGYFMRGLVRPGARAAEEEAAPQQRNRAGDIRFLLGK